ncbi:MAG TPA: serine hydrolase domain-containing protein [Gammaproteobacteria bacterium]
MSHSFRQILIFAVALVATPAAADVIDTRPRASDDDLRAALEDIRERHGVPGLAAAVFDRDSIRAFGLGELGPSGNSVTPDTRFRVGEVSILFTGMAMGALVADGSIPDTGELRELAPEIDLQNPWAAERLVRVADLLAHRAGLGTAHFRDVYTTSRGQPLLAGINSAFRALRVEYRPGEREHFSALGPAIAAYLVEKGTGFPYEKVLARLFFEPLEMSASVGRPSGALPADAVGHSSTGATSALPLNFVTAGGLWISAGDLARVGQMLLNRGRFADHEILKVEAIQWLEAPANDAALVPGFRHGVRAEAFNGFLFYTQTGALPGFLARIAYSPDLGRGYLVLMNHGNAREALAEADALLRGQIMQALPAAPPVPSPAVEAAEIPSLAGWYRNTNPERPPRALYQSWLGVARMDRCADAWCFATIGKTAVLEAFDASRLREAGRWYPGWEIQVSETGVSLNGASDRWQRVPGWQVAGAMFAAVFVIAGVLAGLVLLPAWIVSLVRWPIFDFHELLPRLLPIVAIAAVVAFQVLLFNTGYPALGVVGPASVAILVLSIATPLLALLALAASAAGVAWGLPRSVTLPGIFIASAAALAAIAMIANDLFAFQTWNY